LTEEGSASFILDPSIKLVMGSILVNYWCGNIGGIAHESAELDEVISVEIVGDGVRFAVNEPAD
jgi:hypothetical protein